MFLKAALAILALPGMVIGIIPAILIIYDPWRANEYWTGYIFLTPGLFMLFQSIQSFYVAGKGTLAPWAPPVKIVQVGLYRHIRNPMYVGNLLIILGLALRFGSPLLGAYMVFLALMFHTNLVFIEEPRLSRRFNKEWDQYVTEVPRWFPRV
jgi:protein-S-isoprenylcysteine O-methyltransferase Ste14